MLSSNFKKRLGVLVTSSLITGLISVVPITNANAVLNALDGANLAASAEDVDASLITATERAIVAVIHPATAVATTGHAARSSGLVAKSTSAGLAQTATVTVGGVLSLYTEVTTATAITATGGSFTSASAGATASATSNTTAPTTTGKFFGGISASTAIATLWQAPTVAGTYTVSMYVSQATSATITPSTASGGLLSASIVVTVQDTYHGAVGTGTNTSLLALSSSDSQLLTAVELSTSGSAVVGTTSSLLTPATTAKSRGLLNRDTSGGTAQTATVLAGGSLSLYAAVTTDVAFTATGGSFGSAAGNLSSASYSNTIRNVFMDVSAGANLSPATAVAVIWTAPTTVGTYTVSMDRSASTNQLSTTDYSGTLTGAITVTVVAASAGGSYSAAYSACNTRKNSDGVGVATGIDTTTAFENGHVAYIAFDLDDAYDSSLDGGSLVVSATNGALVSLGTSAAAAAAGSTSTLVSTDAPTNKVVQVIQGTANAPVTSTVTITFNGTTVCTKTVTIRGEVASLAIANVGTEDLSASAGSAAWIADGTNRAGSFTVTAKDSAGNTVAPGASGVSGFAADSATLTTTVQAITISSANVATSVSSSTAAWNYSVGNFTCGATAGESSVKLKYTNPSSGTVVTSPAFTARCADNAYTYTASFDKASYVQGEIATLTVQFLDSKGNKANTVTSNGTVSIVMPFMTAVSATDSATNQPTKADGTRTYTFTVGGASGVTDGTYNGILDFPNLTAVAAVKAVPSYKITSGTTDTPFAEVLKSVIALIASINKQIQALQKLILQRR